MLVIAVRRGLRPVTGGFVAYLKLPSFVMSLAMMAIARGLSLIFSAGRPIPIGDGGEALADFGSGYSVRHPAAGDRDVCDLHRRRDRAQLHELRPHHHRDWLERGGGAALRHRGAALHPLGLCHLGRARCGRRASSRRAAPALARRRSASERSSNVIAAVVIGGASLMGGRGGVINTLLGALVMGIIANIMNLAGVPGYNQNVYMGLIIVLAMLIQYGAGSLSAERMARDLTLSIDIGTGSVRAALVDSDRRDPSHRGARARSDRAAIRLGGAEAARLVGRRLRLDPRCARRGRGRARSASRRSAPAARCTGGADR